ncbi:hypothetical protein [Neomoorella humiferrea]|uniref:CAAX amino terminal protease self-immunity n=1 Tax=Neomoorella humiferrea TaxID=676965 RepID=A0A2T0ATU8_9FIRM|nr:hypothetical protein [Moorella humiferrea]PRR73890.1 hypothetical protein MOHU_10300 [Moorella humiferrea]
MIFWQTFAAGFLAAGTALVVNNLLLRLGPGGRPVLAFLGPLGEEALKTALSFMTGAPLAGVHFVFGCVEACWELTGSLRSGRGSYLKPALAAVAGHTLFGLAASAVLAATSRPEGALVGSVLVHMAWNRFILSLHYFGRKL